MDGKLDDDIFSLRQNDSVDLEKTKKKSSTSKILGLLKRRSNSKKETNHSKSGSLSNSTQSQSKSDTEDADSKSSDYETPKRISSDRLGFCSDEINRESSPKKGKQEDVYDSDTPSKELSKKDRKIIKKEEKKEQKRIKKENKKAQKDKNKKDKNYVLRHYHDSPKSNVIDLISEQAKADEIDDFSNNSPFELTQEGNMKIIQPESALIPPKVSLNDFRVIKLIGKGGFGEVYLVEHIEKERKFALKVLDKSHIAATKKAQCILNERDVLVKGKVNPFLMHLSYSWQDDNYLYLAMKYCPGGDLRSLLDAIGPFEEDESKLYMAEMILSVNFLHQMGYIHRDLKPDNFLIDKHGHLVLADFGLSKESYTTSNFNVSIDINDSSTYHKHVRRAQSILLGDQEIEVLNRMNFNLRFTRTRSNALLSNKPPIEKDFRPNIQLAELLNSSKNRKQKAFSIVGSPEYMSPEILSESGYGEEVDWWSLGCIFFELILGVPPFTGASPEEVFDNITNWQTRLPIILEQYREYISEPCFDLISRLMSHQDKRLGSNGIQEIKNHEFFESINWDSLRDEVPPFIPKLSDDEDTTYFDDKTVNMEQELLPRNGGDIQTKSRLVDHYKCFTYNGSNGDVFFE